MTYPEDTIYHNGFGYSLTEYGNSLGISINGDNGSDVPGVCSPDCQTIGTCSTSWQVHISMPNLESGTPWCYCIPLYMVGLMCTNSNCGALYQCCSCYSGGTAVWDINFPGHVEVPCGGAGSWPLQIATMMDENCERLLVADIYMAMDCAGCAPTQPPE